GINSYFGSSGDVVVAEVDGAPIARGQFQRGFEQFRAQRQMIFGANFEFDEARLKRAALDQMIESLLLERTGLKAGMRISDEQVADAIGGIDAFKKERMFTQELYEQLLRASGMDPAQFEERLRQDLLNAQLRQGLVDSEFLTNSELESTAKLHDQKRRLVYATIPAEKYRSAIAVSDENVQSFYQEHRKDFVTAERVKIAYLDLSVAELAKRVTVGEDALREFYDNHKGDYAKPEQRRIRYVLLTLAKDADQDSITAAKEKAQKIASLARGEKTLQQAFDVQLGNQDAKAEFGETDFFQKGAMDPAFDAAAFGLQKDEVSDPIQTEAGIQILQLSEIKPGTVKSYEEAKKEVETAWRKEQAESQFYDDIERLADLSFENADTLEPAADALDLGVQHSDYFSRDGGDGIAAEPKVIEAAFSPAVLDQGENSETLELDNDRVVVLRVEEHKPTAERPLPEVREEIIKKITDKAVSEKTTEAGAALLGRLQSGASREDLAKETQIEWKETEPVGRADPTVNRAVLGTAFRLPHPKDGKPSYGGVQLGNTDYVLVGVLNVEDATDEKLQTDSRSEWIARQGNQSWRDFVTALKHKADIDVYSERL
ncbi:MAG: SurA N-terminal domain-containing protein, partial [Nitrososphaera sp.]|nr:SurA N-terminal domain-containing protein [Nitrososphaera sp.]